MGNLFDFEMAIKFFIRYDIVSMYVKELRQNDNKLSTLNLSRVNLLYKIVTQYLSSKCRLAVSPAYLALSLARPNNFAALAIPVHSRTFHSHVFLTTSFPSTRVVSTSSYLSCLNT